jgi:hypothetical protein
MAAPDGGDELLGFLAAVDHGDQSGSPAKKRLSGRATSFIAWPI